MSDFSTIGVEQGCNALPPLAWGRTFQSKTMPEHEARVACIDGTIRSDGLFVRFDDRWNPRFNGWAQLREREVLLCVQFVGGVVADFVHGSLPSDFDDTLASDSPNDWRDVPPCGAAAPSVPLAIGLQGAPRTALTAERIVQLHARMSHAEQHDLTAWESVHLTGDGTFATSDWPGWQAISERLPH